MIKNNGLPPLDDGVTGGGHQRDQGPARHLCLKGNYSFVSYSSRTFSRLLEKKVQAAASIH